MSSWYGITTEQSLFRTLSDKLKVQNGVQVSQAFLSVKEELEERFGKAVTGKPRRRIQENQSLRKL